MSEILRVHQQSYVDQSLLRRLAEPVLSLRHGRT
jgi:hypothetical protein